MRLKKLTCLVLSGLMLMSCSFALTLKRPVRIDKGDLLPVEPIISGPIDKIGDRVIPVPVPVRPRLEIM